MIPSLLKPEPCLAAPWISLRQYYLVFKARLYNKVAHSRCAPMYRNGFSLAKDKIQFTYHVTDYRGESDDIC